MNDIINNFKFDLKHKIINTFEIDSSFVQFTEHKEFLELRIKINDRTFQKQYPIILITSMQYNNLIDIELEEITRVINV